MATIVYRSVKVICQNNIQLPLTLMGYGSLAGSWVNEPISGEQIEANTSLFWSIQSANVNIGAAGYLSFNMQYGIVEVDWKLPWIGNLDVQVRTPLGYESSIQIYDEQAAYPSILVTLLATGGRKNSQVTKEQGNKVVGLRKSSPSIEIESGQNDTFLKETESSETIAVKKNQSGNRKP